MPIYDYDEIPDLFYYINSGLPESYTKTGNVVDTINSLTGLGGTMTPYTEPSPGVVTHGDQPLGAMPAFYAPPGSDAVFVDNDTFASGILGPMTFVIAFQVGDPNVTAEIINSANTNSSINYFGLRSNSDNDNLYALVNGGTNLAAADGLLTSPMIAVLTWDNGPGGTDGTQAVNLYLNGGPKTLVANKDGNGVHGFRRLTLFGSQVALDGGMGGTVAIVACYNTFVNDAQAADLYTLTQHWIDENGPPSPVPPPEGTSTFFGPVLTKDTEATLKWQWSSDRATWYDVDDSVNPMPSTIQWSLSDVGQTGNQLNIDSATAEQVVYTQCKATTRYDGEGITSSVNTLTIEAAPDA